MGQYLVKWEIDIEADSAEEAARIALEIQLDNESKARYFDVLKLGTSETSSFSLLIR